MPSYIEEMFNILNEKDNELVARAKRHKKSDKKGAKGWFVKPNAGNVEHNVAFFNHAMGSDAPAAPAGGDAGAGCCEDYKGVKLILDDKQKLELFKMLNRAEFLDDYGMSDEELDREIKKDLAKEWIITDDQSVDPEKDDNEFPYKLLIDGEFTDAITTRAFEVLMRKSKNIDKDSLKEADLDRNLAGTDIEESIDAYKFNIGDEVKVTDLDVRGLINSTCDYIPDEGREWIFKIVDIIPDGSYSIADKLCGVECFNVNEDEIECVKCNVVKADAKDKKEKGKEFVSKVNEPLKEDKHIDGFYSKQKDKVYECDSEEELENYVTSWEPFNPTTEYWYDEDEHIGHITWESNSYTDITKEKEYSIDSDITVRELLDMWWNSVRVEGGNIKGTALLYKDCNDGSYELDEDHNPYGKKILDMVVHTASEWEEDGEGYPIIRATLKKDSHKREIDEARIGKTKEIKVLQGNYGYGWDDLVTYELDDDSIRADIRSYKENEPKYAHRIIYRRVPNPAYVEPKVEELKEEIHTEEIDNIDKFINDVYEMRKESLAKDGEYGIGNLVFKELRNKGYLDKLKEKRIELKSKELSLESLEEDASEEQIGQEYDKYLDNSKKGWEVSGSWTEPKTYDEFRDEFKEEVEKDFIKEWAKADYEVGQTFSRDDFDEFVKVAKDDGYDVDEFDFEYYFDCLDDCRAELAEGRKPADYKLAGKYKSKDGKEIKVLKPNPDMTAAISADLYIKYGDKEISLRSLPGYDRHEHENFGWPFFYRILKDGTLDAYIDELK